MDSMLYYEICFYISAALSFAYICMWHDGLDVNMTSLFILIPIVCLGCVWMYWAPTLEIAILANKLVYLAGCFWPLMATKAILSMCSIKIKKSWTVIAYITSFIFYGFALNTDKPGALYKSISHLVVDGRVELYPEYGWMHTVIYVSMAIYVLLGVVALIYGMKNKVRASIKNMWIMLFGEAFAIIVFFIYGINKLAGSPVIIYVVGQASFLICGYRSYYYNIDSSVMDTVIESGTVGYLTFDSKKRLLGCNETAERYFPELKSIRVDKPLDNEEGFKAIISKCLNQVEECGSSVTELVKVDDAYLNINFDRYKTRGRIDIYRVIMMDDTDHQRLVQMLNTQKDDAERKTKKVSETFTRYIDPSVAKELLSEEGYEMTNKPREENIVVFFADIRGFTTYSENKEPHEVLSLLNQIIETITSVIMDNHGIIDKFIGDCVMAVWTGDSEVAAYSACKAGMDIQKALAELGRKTELESGIKLSVGIGINYGKAIIGNVGTAKRSDYTCIGNTVNLANRVESIAAGGYVLITPAVKMLVDKRATYSVFREDAQLKGVKSKMCIYKVEGIDREFTD